MRIRLECPSPWVKCAPNLELLHNGRTFTIGIDPTGLKPGCHHTSIRGYDVTKAGQTRRGAIITVPITVIVP
ncbi:unnamed protein product, partial [Discosporangium mesarthrocarpum]